MKRMKAVQFSLKNLFWFVLCCSIILFFIFGHWRVPMVLFGVMVLYGILAFRAACWPHQSSKTHGGNGSLAVLTVIFTVGGVVLGGWASIFLLFGGVVSGPGPLILIFPIMVVVGFGVWGASLAGLFGLLGGVDITGRWMVVFNGAFYWAVGNLLFCVPSSYRAAVPDEGLKEMLLWNCIALTCAAPFLSLPWTRRISCFSVGSRRLTGIFSLAVLLPSFLCALLRENEPAWFLMGMPGSLLAGIVGAACGTLADLDRGSRIRQIAVPVGILLVAVSSVLVISRPGSDATPDPIFSVDGLNPEIAISADGKYLVVGVQDKNTTSDPTGTITIWRVGSFEKRWQFSVHMRIQSVAISPDGKELAVSGTCIEEATPAFVKPDELHSGRIQRWNLDSGLPSPDLEFCRGVYSISYSPDGATLAAVEATPPKGSGRIVLMETDSFTPQLVIPASPDVISEHSRMDDAKVVFSPDSSLVAVRTLPVNEPATIGVWDAVTGVKQSEITVGDHSIMSMDLAPDGKSLAIVSNYGLEFRNFRTGDLLPAPISLILPKGRPWVVKYSGDGKTLAVGGIYKSHHRRSYGGIALWNTRDQESVNNYYLTTPSSDIVSIAFSPNGKTVFAASIDGSIWSWPISQ